MEQTANNQLNLTVQDGMEFQEFKSYMDGYAAGVEAATQAAIEAKLKQVSRKAQPAPPAPPAPAPPPVSDDPPQE